MKLIDRIVIIESSYSPENSGQVLVETDMLPDGVDDASAGLEETLVVPVAVERLELGSDAVMLAEHGSM